MSIATVPAIAADSTKSASAKPASANASFALSTNSSKPTVKQHHATDDMRGCECNFADSILRPVCMRRTDAHRQLVCIVNGPYYIYTVRRKFPLHIHCSNGMPEWSGRKIHNQCGQHRCDCICDGDVHVSKPRLQCVRGRYHYRTRLQSAAHAKSTSSVPATAESSAAVTATQPFSSRPDAAVTTAESGTAAAVSASSESAASVSAAAVSAAAVSSSDCVWRTSSCALVLSGHSWALRYNRKHADNLCIP